MYTRELPEGTVERIPIGHFYFRVSSGKEWVVAMDYRHFFYFELRTFTVGVYYL